MQHKKLLFVLLAAVFLLVFYFDLGQWLSLEAFTQHKDRLVAYQHQNGLLLAALYFLLYVLITALSLPGAAIMTLVGGALFGFWLGLVLISFASTIGATLAFLISRSLLKDWVQSRFSKQLSSINEGMRKDGAFYLFSLRLIPLFPFFVINLVMGLSSLSTARFYWVSQVGMLAGTAVYVNAGTQLGQLESVSGILSPQLWLSFVLLALLPWLAKGLMRALKSYRYFSSYKKPSSFDNNLIVIGAGAAGLVSAYIAAMVKAKVTLIEKHQMGGDCLNTGCVPSKALIRSSRIAHYIKTAEHYGLSNSSLTLSNNKVFDSAVSYSAVMARVKKVIDGIAPHDSVERYTQLGVDCLSGEAKLISPWQVEVNGEIISAKNIIVASGGRPATLNVPGIDEVNAVNSDTIWSMAEQPKHLLVIGGGPIACELAQSYRRLGSRVTMLVRSQIMPKEDADVSVVVQRQFEREGITVFTGVVLKGFSKQQEQSYEQQQVMFSLPGEGQQERQAQQLEFDVVLVAVGRQANTEQLGFEKLGIECRPDGTVEVDEHLKTSCPTVYACGDVAGPYQFTHVASHQAWYAAVNTLMGVFKRFKVDYSVIPWVTFSDPEVARVGLNEKEAQASNIAYEVTRFDLDDLDRAIADSQTQGFIKVLTVPGKDKLLGVTIVGYHASELISEYILAMRHGLGLNKILATIHIYPTFSEANKYVAGEWKKKHKPELVLRYLEKFHQWRRS